MPMPLTQAYRGSSYYSADHPEGSHRLLVAVPCTIGELADAILALLDTGSQWCVLPFSIAAALGHDPADSDEVRLHTRYGTLLGRLDRLRVRFRADEGEPLELEATWFITQDWPGPAVIGWKGCLERFRFALDPEEDTFYFGAPAPV